MIYGLTRRFASHSCSRREDLRNVSHLDGKLLCWHAGSMKMTIDLPDDLVRDVKLRAVHERLPVKRLVADFLRQSLRRDIQKTEPAVSERVIITEIGLPLFRCQPDSTATRMTAEEVIALEQSIIEGEDLRRVGIPL